jgi:hypothetical protein
MRLFFEVREGPNRGLRAPVSAGLQIGRSVAYGLRIKDSKASSVHAEVHIDESGRLVLIDKGSTNRIKTSDGKVDSLNLYDGLTFKIGNTRFHVVAEEDEKKSAVEHQEERQLDRPEWRDGLVDYFRSSDLRIHSQKVEIRAFSPAIEVEVMRGYQIGTIWTLGYGPREFGRICGDLSLWDETCPDQAFRLSALSSGTPTLHAFDDCLIKLNDRPTRTSDLNDGDLIEVGETVLKVRFL